MSPKERVIPEPIGIKPVRNGYIVTDRDIMHPATTLVFSSFDDLIYWLREWNGYSIEGPIGD